MVQISGGGSVFSYNPCFVNMAPAGISLSATGVNIGAPLVGISPAGISINPQGLNIQPVTYLKATHILLLYLTPAEA